MDAKKLYRLAGWVLLSGNILGIVRLFLDYTVSNVDEPQRINQPLFVPTTIIWYLAAYLGLFGFIGFYLRQAKETGILGLVGFVMLFFGEVALGIGDVTNWAVTLTNYWSDSKGVYSIPDTSVAPFALPLPLVVLLGTILFAIAIIRAGVFPKIIGILMLVGIPLLFVGLAVSFLFNLADAFSAVPYIIAGVWLIQHPAEKQNLLSGNSNQLNKNVEPVPTSSR